MRSPVILLLLFFIGLCAGCQDQEENPFPEVQGVPVKVTKPRGEKISENIESLGTLKASISASINPRIEGVLEERLVKEGDWVEKGEPLFKLDRTYFAIKVKEEQAQLSIYESERNALEKKIKRFSELVSKDLIAQTEWDDLQSQLEKATAMIALQNARLESAKVNDAYTTIYSPVSGRVGKIDYDPGQYVSPNQSEPLVKITQIDPLKIDFTVTEKEYPLIPKNLNSFEIIGLCTESCLRGGVITIQDNYFDKQSGLLHIRGTIPNPNQQLLPGQSVKVLLPLIQDKEVLLIPQKAIRYNQNGPYVYVIDQQMKVELRPLKLGQEYGKDQVVLEGVEPNEEIVLEGHLRLSQGTKVAIVS